MSVIDPEEDRSEPSPLDRSAAEYREEQDKLRERQELISALRNFAEHFGAEEVYEQAKAIYLEGSGGQAGTAQETAAASFAALLQDAGRPVTERQQGSGQKRPPAGRKPGGGSPAAEAARKLLGG